MEQWMTNVNGSVGLNQVCVVVYFEGLAGDNENGLGNSQKGEVAWLEEQKIPYVAWDIREFERRGPELARKREAPGDSELYFRGQ